MVGTSRKNEHRKFDKKNLLKGRSWLKEKRTTRENLGVGGGT